ncbi:TerB family tellurite resistance protein [Alphaproteobacteria bacterium]|nr:TerB family tellurite resistance protein [Alphaproteobacteria bacterium]
MFSNLKSAMAKITSHKEDQDVYNGEDIQAVIVLLIEASQIDGDSGSEEINHIKNLLMKKFNFTENEADDNIKKALADNETRIEIFSQIKILLNEMDHKERVDVIEMMWGVILADGVIDDFEANLMRRMNGLLYISGIESAEAKEKAANQLK